MSEGGRFRRTEGDNLQSYSVTQAGFGAALHCEISHSSHTNHPKKHAGGFEPEQKPIHTSCCGSDASTSLCKFSVTCTANASVILAFQNNKLTPRKQKAKPNSKSLAELVCELIIVDVI